MDQAEQSLKGYTKDSLLLPKYQEAKSKIGYVRWLLEQSDPSLFASKELDQISSGGLQNIVNVLNANISSPQNLSQLDPHFTSIMQQIPYPRVRKIFRSETSEAIDEFRSMIATVESGFRASIEQAQNQVDLINKKLEGATQGIEQLSSDLQSMKAQVQSQTEVWENEQKAEIAERLGELNTEFEESQTRRRTENDKQVERISELLDKVRSEAQASHIEARKTMHGIESDLATWRQKELASAEETLGKIRNIYEVVGQTAMAGDFEKAAKEEASNAWWFSLAATIFFIIAPVFFAYQWASLDLTKQDYAGILSKITGSAVFLIPAAYFASTAQRHRRVATALRSLGVRVATFDAYLANFDDKERTAIKADMASVFFDANISPDKIRTASRKEMEQSISVYAKLIDRLEATVGKATGSGS